MEKDTVKKIIAWTQDALHTGKITGSDDEIAEMCMKDVEFDALCDPDIYEASMNEHLENILDNEEKIEILKRFTKYFNNESYGSIEGWIVEEFINEELNPKS